MKKKLKYVNTLKYVKILEVKKVKYRIHQIHQTRFFPVLSYNAPYLLRTASSCVLVDSLKKKMYFTGQF